MDYRRFAELRAPLWDELEQGLVRAREGRLDYHALERLSLLYRQVLHDHSIARARFAGTAIARRLQRLVIEATHQLQRDSGEDLPTLSRFVRRVFPSTFRRLHPEIGVAIAVFCAATLLGAALAAVEPAVATIFLPQGTIDDLDRGVLWTDAILENASSSMVSSSIALNNLKVLFMAFAGGALAGLGALFVLTVNGLMLGTVLITTAHYGLSDRLGEFIAAHGPLELSLIMISAGAGLHVGRELIFAGDLPRADRLRRAGRESLIVLLGCVPFILLLGVVEGYVSPSDLPLSYKLAIGFSIEAVFLAWTFFPVAEPAALAGEVG
jgi:uncharacterized membrane protein SpoIIM required for sporulation